MSAINDYLINQYKSEQRIITDYYKYRDTHGKLHDLTGIINPIKIDNRQLISPIDDQKSLPACAGYSAATLIESLYWKLTGKLKQLDSVQVYALAKRLDGQQQIDGTYLEAALRAVIQLCLPDTDFSFLKNVTVKTFFNDMTSNTIKLTKQLIHKFDFIQVGFNIDEGWNHCTNNEFKLRPMGASLGGHAVGLCGYDSDGFYVFNQWGTNWGAKGFAIMPYDLFTKQFMYGAYLTNITY